MTQSHIKVAPLILPRKTPAEELREIAKVAHYSTTGSIIDQMVDLAARLEAPDEPKRWDGVFPWVSEFGPYYANVHFSPVLRWHLISNGTCIYTGEAHEGDKPSNKSPYHDGVIITITAGSGDEFPRVLKDSTDTLYLCLGEGSGKCVIISDGPWGRYRPGHVDANWDGAEHGKPLPPGTVTRITINHTLPTTEQRYSVEVVEAPAPLVVCNPKVSTANVLDSIEAELNRARAKFPGGENNFAACVEEVGELAQALLKRQHEGGKSHEDVWQEAVQVAVTAIRVATEGDASFPAYDPESGYRGKNWNGYKDDTATANHLDPQEQPATETVAEGLPLKMPLVMRCSRVNDDKVYVDDVGDGLKVKIFQGRDYCTAYLSPRRRSPPAESAQSAGGRGWGVMYGVCPKCGGGVSSRERGLNGNDTCMNGHKYPSRETLARHTYDRVAELTATLTELTQSASELLAQMPLIAPKGAEILRADLAKAREAISKAKGE